MSSYKSDKIIVKKNVEDLFNTLTEFENLKNVNTRHKGYICEKQNL